MSTTKYNPRGIVECIQRALGSMELVDDIEDGEDAGWTLIGYIGRFRGRHWYVSQCLGYSPDPTLEESYSVLRLPTKVSTGRGGAQTPAFPFKKELLSFVEDQTVLGKIQISEVAEKVRHVIQAFPKGGA